MIVDQHASSWSYLLAGEACDCCNLFSNRLGHLRTHVDLFLHCRTDYLFNKYSGRAGLVVPLDELATHVDLNSMARLRLQKQHHDKSRHGEAMQCGVPSASQKAAITGACAPRNKRTMSCIKSQSKHFLTMARRIHPTAQAVSRI